MGDPNSGERSFSVRVLHIDTRSPYEELQAQLRTWCGGPDHNSLRHFYFANNPVPPARPYYAVSAVTTAWQCKRLGWSYEFIVAEPLPDRHPSWLKLWHCLQAWDTFRDDVIVVLDTDAWIRDGAGFEHVVTTMLREDTLCLLSGEPDCHEARVHHANILNGGFLCFKRDAKVREFFDHVWSAADTEAHAMYKNSWPWEQSMLCQAYTGNAAGCQDWARVLPVAMTNTPAGTLVTHCWYKDVAYQLAVDDLLSVLAADLFKMARPTIELVVARYNEEVDWLYEWAPFVDKITVYDKSDTPVKSLHPKLTVERLPNVGRESHTYAHHFATKYDSLCDVTICTQGRYDDHMTRAQFEALVRGQEQNVTHGLDIQWSSTPMQHFGWTVENNWSTAHMTPAGMSMAKFYLAYVGDDIVPEAEVSWWQNAEFRVTAHEVHGHARSKYAALEAALGGSPNPEAGHMMERFWRALFHPPGPVAR